MLNYKELNLLGDSELNRLNSVKLVIKNMITNESYLLYFISPEVDTKGSIIRSILCKYEHDIPKELLKKLKLLALDFNAEDLLEDNSSKFDENQLVEVYAYFAKFKNIPQWVLQRLLEEVKEKSNSSRLIFLINILLSSYYLHNNNFDLAESHIKYCIEYINYNINYNDYETMSTYVVCGRYLEKTTDVFVSCAGNYYSLAEEIAVKIEDEISLTSILSNLSYYYHNIGERDKSLAYAHRALALAEKFNLSNLSFGINKNLAIISLTMGDYKTASEHLKKTINVSEGLKNFSILESIKLKNTLGYIYYLKGNFSEALEIHLEALKALSNVDSTSEILDEAVKTLDNLSSTCKMLGDIKTSIYFAEKTLKIIDDCNLGHKVNDIQNLCKLYTDIGILYGLYLDDFDSSLKYYSLAKSNINKNDHYIKYGNLTILEAYILFTSGDAVKSQEVFNKALTIFKTHDHSNTLVQSLLITYYFGFSDKFPNARDAFIQEARYISKNFNLEEHYDFAVNFFIHKRIFEPLFIEQDKYPLNFIMLLSEERRHSLRESKRARDFELIQNFSNKINSALLEINLYEEAQNLFNRYFFTKGFISAKDDFKEGLTFSTHFQSDIYSSRNSIIKFLSSFIEKHNLALNSHGKNYGIYSFSIEESSDIRSMIIYYIFDEINLSNYYFIIFYDRNTNWLFSNDDAEVGLILIKNLFLKLKTIHYTEKIRSNTLIDFVTGLYNAQFMWNKLEELINTNKTSAAPFSMAVLDLNDFKIINDTYGHFVGDEAIRFFSKILRVAVGGHNHVIRYGGDEFIIIFLKASKTEAEKNIAKVKSICASQPFVFNERSIYLDFAYGIDEYSSQYDSSKTFFKIIDKKMYNYKLNNKRTAHDFPCS